MSIKNLVATAADCENKTLSECADYFGTTNPQFDWCAWFVRMCASKNGMDFGSSNLAKELKGTNGNFQFKAGAQGTTNNKPKVGDLLFIQPVNTSGINHIGICCGVDPNGNITSWEGNMSGRGNFNKSYVRKASYPYNSDSSTSWGKIINYGANS